MAQVRTFLALVAAGLLATGAAWGASGVWADKTDSVAVQAGGQRLLVSRAAVTVARTADGARLSGRIADIAAAEDLPVLVAGPFATMTFEIGDTAGGVGCDDGLWGECRVRLVRAGGSVLVRVSNGWRAHLASVETFAGRALDRWEAAAAATSSRITPPAAG